LCGGLREITQRAYYTINLKQGLLILFTAKTSRAGALSLYTKTDSLIIIVIIILLYNRNTLALTSANLFNILLKRGNTSSNTLSIININLLLLVLKTPVIYRVFGRVFYGCNSRKTSNFGVKGLDLL
jgi:hypothetical protein